MSEKVLTKAPLEADEIELKRRKQFNRNKWLFSVGGIGRDMAYALIGTFLVTYIQFGVPLSVPQFTVITLLVGVIGPIWDGINDPIMGAIIEGTHMKWGKFKPWIFLGAVSCSIVILLMFNIRPEGWWFVVFMIVMYLLWESTFTMNDIGYWAMLPSLSSVNKERDSATMFTVLFAGIGAIIAQLAIPNLTTGNMVKGYALVSVIVALSFIGFQTLTSFGVKETPRKGAEQSKPISMKKMWATIKNNDQLLWMTLSMVFYSVGSALVTALAANLVYSELSYDGGIYTIIVSVYGAVNIFISVVYPWLSRKLGRRKLQFWSIMLAIVGYVMLGLMGWTSLFPSHVVFFAVFIVFIAMGQSMFYMSSIVNMTNCVEYNDFKQGERNEAVVSTLRPFMAKVSAAIHMFIVLIVLVISGIYGISGNISAMETQKSMFESKQKLETVNEQIEYIEEIQYYIAQLKGLEGEALANKTSELMDALEQNHSSILTGLQLDITYAPVLGDTIIVARLYDKVSGLEVEGKDYIFTKRLKDLTKLEILARLILNPAPDGKEYRLSMEVGTVTGFNGHSAADLNFREIVLNKDNIVGRITLRAAVTVLPITFLLIALFIQRKKFIIDEPYYDMMLDEIAKRDAAKEK